MTPFLTASLQDHLDTRDTHHLLEAVRELSRQTGLEGVTETVRHWAKVLTDADGVTFVLRDGDEVYYAEENAIGPLWKGLRFPIEACISGWAILNRQAVMIEDIYRDERIPIDAYRPTFVRSLAMVPVRADDPIGSIGAYWAAEHRATDREMAMLQALADATSVAMTNIYLVEQLRDAVRVRDDFLRVAARSLQTPVTIVGGQLQALSQALGPVLESAQPGAVTRLADLGANLDQVTLRISQMLDAARAYSGGLAPSPEFGDLREIVDRVGACLQPMAADAGCVLTVTAPDPVPGVWDNGQLQTVVFSLMMNAIGHGRGKPVEVTLGVSDHAVSLHIRDFGAGLSPDDQRRIFQRYRRSATGDEERGFGLGLWVTKAIIEAHGGSIAVESAPRAGSTFRVCLPMRPGQV